MKNRFLFITFFYAIMVTSCAQSEKIADEKVNYSQQYERTIVRDSIDSNKIIVKFSFTNGNEQTAISYRQETMKNKIVWDAKCEKLVKYEYPYVEKITTNLSPNSEIEWSYSIITPENSDSQLIEKAALLIMDSNFKVEKIVFDSLNFEIKKLFSPK